MSSVSAKKPFAVEQVTNTQGVIPSYGLSAEYDARGKVSSITEYDTWRTLLFTYGPDGGRWQMAVTDYGDYDDEWTYLGDMEKFQKGHSTVRGYWYLGNGVMMFRDTDNPAFNTMTPLYAFTDNQGSYIDFFRSNGTRVFEAKYDPWGVQTVVTDSILFHRGYGGHEMLNEFGIINMGGRLYDPLLGRFLSPDNYVQEPFNTQNLNRYSYCLNNPVKYTDPDGEWFGLLPAFFGVGNMLAHKHAEGHWRLDHNLKYLAQGTLAGLAVNGISNWGHHIPFVGKIISNVATAGMGFSTLLGGYYGGRAILANWIIRGSKGFQLSKRIWLGQFYLDDNFSRGFWEGVGRYTWEFPQTAVGHLYNQDYNTVVGADRVDYLDGATFATYYSKTKEDGVTLGNFINITNPDRISGDFSSYVTKNQLYMHEFGHYVDSHYWGLSYLMCIGIPSLYSASKSGNYQKILNDNGEFIGYIPPNHNHRLFWTEKRANRRAWRHFRDHHGLKKWIDKDENTLLPMYPRHKLHY